MRGEKRIVPKAAITHADIKVAIGTENDRAAVVVPIGLLDLKKNLFTAGITLIGIVFHGAKARDDGELRLFFACVIDKKTFRWS